MFTGLIETIGTVVSATPIGGDVRITISSNEYAKRDVSIGDSIAIDGVCLTVIERNGADLSFDVSVESISHTCIREWVSGKRVNLEMALLPTTRLGGHMVSGHVDGLAKIVGIRDEGDSTRITMTAPEALARFIAPKGSVALNGTSLTVNEVEGRDFGINVIPHTKQATTWGEAQVGDLVNLEIDTLARYVARLQETL